MTTGGVCAPCPPYTRYCIRPTWRAGSACSFGLFNYDSFVSFRAIGVIWGIRELTAELVCLLFWSLFLVPTLWGTLPCPYLVGDSSLSLSCGGLFLVPTLWGTLLCPLPCYGTDNQRHENHLHVDCPGVGQVASVRGLPGSRAGCTGLTNRLPRGGLTPALAPRMPVFAEDV